MLKPIGERILVEELKKEKVTKSGIILADSSTNDDLKKAKVIEVSSEIKNILKGDIVYFSKFKGENIKFEFSEYIIVEYKDILAKEEV